MSNRYWNDKSIAIDWIGILYLDPGVQTNHSYPGSNLWITAPIKTGFLSRTFIVRNQIVSQSKSQSFITPLQYFQKCGEYIMLKNFELHLNSNHGFLKLNDGEISFLSVTFELDPAVMIINHTLNLKSILLIRIRIFKITAEFRPC